jgi:hypothetical protein
VTSRASKRGPSHHEMSFAIHFCLSFWSSYLYSNMNPGHGTNATAWFYEDDAEAFNTWNTHYSQYFQPLPGRLLSNSPQTVNSADFQHCYFPSTMTSPALTDSQPSEPSQQPKRSFQCPIYQANLINGPPFSCKGLKAENMAAVRRHVKRSHIPSQVSFIKLCPACNEDIIDKEKFEHEHGKNGEFCDSHQQQQRRGKAAEEQWNALSRKLNPSSAEVASPCKYLS